MANFFTVSSRQEFNTVLWTKAALGRQYSYKQPNSNARRAVPAEKGEPPGANNGRKNYHPGFVQHWWAFEEHLAEEACRLPDYTLIHEPPSLTFMSMRFPTALMASLSAAPSRAYSCRSFGQCASEAGTPIRKPWGRR